ncbi:hypothetical protein BV25DRAFT_1910592 [Artomyces pyxidatus]|uniref:Uncharacterized protein n=1 Tax=Artomyces pyxidatus TaxID=48021 RepID=A0ACB8TK66_9AGAM|nr:hypothetical protein BV25DRAFT_1910592 [Artomyces pyxidatus]
MASEDAQRSSVPEPSETELVTPPPHPAKEPSTISESRQSHVFRLASPGNLSSSFSAIIIGLTKSLHLDDFILIGGAYMNYLGCIRATKDADILVGVGKTHEIQATLLTCGFARLSKQGKLEVVNEGKDAEAVEVDILERTNIESGVYLDVLKKHTVVVGALGGVRVPDPAWAVPIKLVCWLSRLESNDRKAVIDRADVLFLVQLLQNAGSAIPMEAKDWFPLSLQDLVYVKAEVPTDAWDAFMDIQVGCLYDAGRNDEDQLEILVDEFELEDIAHLESWLWQSRLYTRRVDCSIEW